MSWRFVSALMTLEARKMYISNQWTSIVYIHTITGTACSLNKINYSSGVIGL